MKRSPLSRPEIIRQYLMNQIYSNHEENLMIPSERELCRQFNVTRPTVRLALKGLIQDGILEIRPGVGTFVVSPIYNTDEFKNPYRIVAILMGDGRLAAMDRFFLEINAFAGIELARNNVKIRPGVLLGCDRENTLIELSRLKVDGVVWICPPDLEYPHVLEKMGIPVICINRGMDDPELSCVYQDMEEAGHNCGQQLLERNMRNIFHLRRPGSQSDNYFRSGMISAFSEANVPFSEHLTVEEIPGWQDKFKFMLDYKIPIDAIYADSQLISDILAVMHGCGVTPGTRPCLISSKHRIELSPNIPGIMLDMPLETLGKLAASRLLERLEGKTTGRICDCLPIPIIDKAN